MAVVSRQEFADICGKHLSHISVYIGRRKLTTQKDNPKLMSTTSTLNKLFIEKCRGERKGQDEVKKVLQTKKPKPQPEEEEMSEFEKSLMAEEGKKSGKKKNSELLDTDLLVEAAEAEARKKIHDANKAEWQAKQAELNVEKMMGNLMPVELVNSIIRTNVQHIFRSFESDLINVSGIYCDILAGGDRAKQAEIIDKLRHHLAYTIKTTESTALQEIENVINEFSETRNRGEKR